VFTPSYGELSRAAALARHGVKPARTTEAYADADLIMVANPNNPDGRLLD
jgi:cobalamin biosynthesis protein CobC